MDEQKIVKITGTYCEDCDQFLSGFEVSGLENLGRCENCGGHRIHDAIVTFEQREPCGSTKPGANG